MTNDASAATKWVIRDLTLDFENGLVIRAGKPITVRHKLFELLAFFARNQNRVVSKDELVLAVWRGAAITDDALTQTVSQARRCIGDQDRKDHPHDIQKGISLRERHAARIGPQRS